MRHNLGSREALVLWGDGRFALPAWFTSRFPARYVHARLFDWPDTALAGKTLTTPPGLPEDLRVAAPSVPFWSCCTKPASSRASKRPATSSMDCVPRKDLLGQLLSCCASVKAVRLFLTWARETSLVDVDALLEQYPVRTGSNTRWMSRLDDGTLLSLRPHG